MRKQQLIRLAVGWSMMGASGCTTDHTIVSPDPRTRAANGSTSSNLSFVPTFPGAGNSGADDPLVGGMVCDIVTGEADTLLLPTTECFFVQGQAQPVATIEQVLECVEGVDAVHLRLTLDPALVDNSYGETAIGWGDDDLTVAAPAAPGMPAAPPDPGKKAGMPKDKGMKPGMPGKRGHTWMDLVGSDHAELLVTNTAGEVVSQFKLDYISQSADAPSGYESLGVLGGDGKMIVGDPRDVVFWRTSIERNLNERGYADYTDASPETDSDYTPNIDALGWDYRVVYEAWIDNAVFGPLGFGGALIEHVHASPSKASSDTLDVTPGPCPCVELDGNCVPPIVNCVIASPDDPRCADASVPPTRTRELICEEDPRDPICSPD